MKTEKFILESNTSFMESLEKYNPETEAQARFLESFSTFLKEEMACILHQIKEEKSHQNNPLTLIEYEEYEHLLNQIFCKMFSS